MTSLMKQSNADLFASKEMTHEIIQSRGYLKVLEYYQPKIREWLSSFESIEGDSYMSVLSTGADLFSSPTFANHLND